MLRETKSLGPGKEVLLLDSISQLTSLDSDQVVACGSHGGIPSAEYALRYHIRGVLFNDAGVGKEDAGTKGLQILDIDGISAATVSCNSSRIGDARDTFENGVISTTNKLAYKRGIVPGMKAVEALKAMTEK